jgi:hypothetical protein
MPGASLLRAFFYAVSRLRIPPHLRDGMIDLADGSFRAI